MNESVRLKQNMTGKILQYNITLPEEHILQLSTFSAFANSNSMLRKETAHIVGKDNKKDEIVAWDTFRKMILKKVKITAIIRAK